MRTGRKGTLGVRLGSCVPGQVGQEVYLSDNGKDLLWKGSCYLSYMVRFGFLCAVHDGNVQVLKSLYYLIRCLETCYRDSRGFST